MNMFDSDETNSFTRHVFSSDPLSPFRYDKVHGETQEQAGHKALKTLMLAVLEDGIACFQAYYCQPSRPNEKLFHEASEWIYSNDDEVFSFNSVCETLGFHPGKIRKGLEQWKATQLRTQVRKRRRLIINKGKCRKTQLKTPLYCRRKANNAD